MRSDRPAPGGTDRSRLPVRLRGVPETTLWTLYHRAAAAGRPGSGFADPRALELVRAIDYPFAARFGRDRLGVGQAIALRARSIDIQLRAVLATDPDCVVCSLGEGLETQFWRVDNGRVRWLSVDLPETIAVRCGLVGDDPPRRRSYAGSALDPGWMDALNAAPGDRVVIVCQGLLMYLSPDSVRDLIARCAERFPRGVLVLDTAPAWFAALSRHGVLRLPSGFTAPAMPWGMDAGDHDSLAAVHPNIAGVRAVGPGRGRGPLFGLAVPAAARIPLLRRLGPSVIRIDFGP